MKFDYFEHVSFAATVCDKEGIVLYQNTCSIERNGNVIGQNLYGCHNPRSAAMIKDMIAHGGSNTYQVIKHGQLRLIHQTPWYEEATGEVAGLIELSIAMPDNCPTYNRDKKE